MLRLKVYTSLVFCFLVFHQNGEAQIRTMQSGRGSTANHSDTASKKKINWHDESIRVSQRTLNTTEWMPPDTDIHFFHERKFYDNWRKDIGNLGSPVHSLWVAPIAQNRTGLVSGCNTFDVYRFFNDQIPFYQTNKPYSIFTYQMGSKLEQLAQILHSQNIRPNWNVAASYRKITSPGYFKIQRTNHDNAFLTTHYRSLNQHYELLGSFVYNKEQNDENGGLNADSLLTDARYSDRKTIPVYFQNDAYSTVRSAVTNVQRDFNLMIQQHYVFGKADTLYNNDSTQYHIELKSKFRLTHQLEVGSEQHTFKNMQPDSLQYITFLIKIYYTQILFFINKNGGGLTIK